MISIRLEKTLERQLEQYSQRQQVSKSCVMRDALTSYFAMRAAQEAQQTPYELGRDLFGKHASGTGDLSVTYKQRLKDKLRANHAH
ncbi:MAG: ribbon-helix-helix domain-containing protein [Sinobacteraceae bacterium]|nr:ribbon-helix-helix domain-containing protein [Nevskiaceae bacterium]